MSKQTKSRKVTSKKETKLPDVIMPKRPDAKAQSEKKEHVYISPQKKKSTVEKLEKSLSMADIVSAMSGLEPAERNALAFEISENIDRIVKLK